MSDRIEPQELTKDAMCISFADFIRFLDGVEMKTECTECGTEAKWGVDTGNGDTEQEDDFDFLTVYKMPYAKKRVFRTFFAMSCENCGSYRHIYADRVQMWLDQNKDVKDVEE